MKPRIELLKQSNGIHVVLFGGQRGEFKLVEVAPTWDEAVEAAKRELVKLQEIQ